MNYKDTRISDFETATTSRSDQQPTSDLRLHTNVLEGFRIQVTNRFSIQFSYISQLLQYAFKNSHRGKILRTEYVNHLGLTKRHAEAVCSVAVSFDLIAPKRLTITQIGKTMAEGDPYLEYIGSLWILHYNVASNKKWLVWNTLINEVFSTKQRITLGQAKAGFDQFREKLSKSTMTKRIPGEIATILDAYTSKSFGKLGIIQKENSTYIFHRIDAIPPEILTTATLIFRQRYSPNASGLSIETLSREKNSPGRILNIEEGTIRKILEQASRKGLLFIERKADLDQIRFREGVSIETLLKMYYEGLKK